MEFNSVIGQNFAKLRFIFCIFDLIFDSKCERNWEKINKLRKKKNNQSGMFFLYHCVHFYLNLMDLLQFYCHPSRHLLIQSQQWKNQYNGWNLFEVNNKDTKTTSFWCFHCWIWTSAGWDRMNFFTS